MLHAPPAVTLPSRTLTGVQFVDDLPRLDRLGFAPGRTDALVDPRAVSGEARSRDVNARARG